MVFNILRRDPFRNHCIYAVGTERIMPGLDSVGTENVTLLCVNGGSCNILKAQKVCGGQHLLTALKNQKRFDISCKLKI